MTSHSNNGIEDNGMFCNSGQTLVVNVAVF
jgi:hypothetical protein